MSRWMSLTNFCCSLVQVASRTWLLLVNKRHTITGMKGDVGDMCGVCTPAHVTGDKISVPQIPFYHSNMAQTISPLYPWLQIHDPAHIRCAGHVPVEIVGTRCPLPGI